MRQPKVHVMIPWPVGTLPGRVLPTYVVHKIWCGQDRAVFRPERDPRFGWPTNGHQRPRHAVSVSLVAQASCRKCIAMVAAAALCGHDDCRAHPEMALACLTALGRDEWWPDGQWERTA